MTDSKSVGRNTVRVRFPSLTPRDSDLSHFGNNPKMLAEKCGLKSPKRNKQYADELTQMRMKEVKETVAQFVKDKRNQINPGMM